MTRYTFINRQGIIDIADISPVLIKQAYEKDPIVITNKGGGLVIGRLTDWIHHTISITGSDDRLKHKWSLNSALLIELHKKLGEYLGGDDMPLWTKDGEVIGVTKGSKKEKEMKTLYDARLRVSKLEQDIRDKILEFEQEWPDLAVSSVHVQRTKSWSSTERSRLIVIVESSLASGIEPRNPRTEKELEEPIGK